MAVWISVGITRSAWKSRTLWVALLILAGITAVVVNAVLAGDRGTLTNIGFYVRISIVFAILALGFNLQWGYTGLFNAGVAGFYLVGAYVAAIAITAPAPPRIIQGIVVYPGHLGGYSLPLFAGMFLAMLAAGATAAVIALPALRLRADYLAIATLAFAEILQIFATNLESLTGGTIGIIKIPPPIDFQPPDPFLNALTLVTIGGIILLFLLLVLQFMAESPWGRVLRAVREDEEATMALGKNTFRYKLQAFALGGSVMGLAGALFAINLAYLEPSASFAPAITFSVWVMVIVGGSGNNRGVIIGAFLIYGMEWLSVQLKDLASGAVATVSTIGDIVFDVRVLFIGLGLGAAILLLLPLFRLKSEAAWGRVLRAIQEDRKVRWAVFGAALVYELEWLALSLKGYVPVAVTPIVDNIFYVRLMLIGLLLILLIVYRPEGILREKKRVLR